MSGDENARQELLAAVGDRRVAYGKIIRDTSYGQRPTRIVAFNSHDEYLLVLPSLDFMYDSGFGGQELYGFVVFDDATWLERHEYDGSERWDYKRCPTRESVAAFVTT